MKKISRHLRFIAFFMAIVILATSCASSTLINSIPSGAKVYVDEEPVGTTPYKHTDTKIIGSSSYIKLKKEGYEDFHTVITRDEEIDVGALIGGLFVYIPLLWVMKYKPSHTYELTPENQPQPSDQ